MKIMIKKLTRRFKAKEVKQARSDKTEVVSKPKTEKDYFKSARSWADDIYTSTIVSRNRYKMAFLGMTALCALLALSVMVLAPIQHTELVVVHEGDNGFSWLSTTKSHEHISSSWAKTQSEIAHYVVARESYDPTTYQYQTGLVQLLSSPRVQAEYEISQDSSNKSSPINLLGSKGYRTVTVKGVFQLDSKSKNVGKQKNHTNLAQVNYVVEDHFFGGEGQSIKTDYTVLVSWKYTGIPSQPSEMFRDWDGFKVTKFIVQQTSADTNN